MPGVFLKGAHTISLRPPPSFLLPAVRPESSKTCTESAARTVRVDTLAREMSESFLVPGKPLGTEAVLQV
jgi:hypothetical protein